MPAGFVLVPSPPRLAEYQQLCSDAGLPARTDPQATGALRGSWAFGHVRFGERVVAMGRVIGDGGWSFTITDLATAPGYRTQGLGGRVLGWLLTQIRLRAPADPTVMLLAGPSTLGLFERAGFRVTARCPAGVHMTLGPS